MIFFMICAWIVLCLVFSVGVWFGFRIGTKPGRSLSGYYEKENKPGQNNKNNN